MYIYIYIYIHTTTASAARLRRRRTVVYNICTYICIYIYIYIWQVALGSILKLAMFRARKDGQKVQKNIAFLAFS